jgi:hypothetical protein
MLGRLLGQNAGGFALVGGIFVAVWVCGFWLGTMTVPSPPRPPTPAEPESLIRSRAIQNCYEYAVRNLISSERSPDRQVQLLDACRRSFDVRSGVDARPAQ